MGFHEIQYWFLYEKLLSKCDFCGNWHDHSHALHTGVTEFSCIFHISWPVWVKFSTEALHIMSFLYHCCFCENQCSEGHTLCKVLNKIVCIFFYIFHPSRLKFSTGIVHSSVLSKFEFCENWKCESHTAHGEIN